MTDFLSAYDQIQASYHHLISLIDVYPTNKTEKSGALGVWSPKQVVAHLSGWVVEATQRYRDISKGNVPDKTYSNFDDFNAQSVSNRESLTWAETIADFKQAVKTWFDLAETLPAIQVMRDKRFTEWLQGLDREFVNHAEDLRLFIREITADYPILEFDPERSAMLEPSKLQNKLDDMPEYVVMCFFQDVIKGLQEQHHMPVIKKLGSEMGPQ